MPGFLNLNHMAMLALTLGVVMPSLAGEGIPSAERQQELTRFVRQECGFCHGLKLTGGLGTPLTREAMRERQEDHLVQVIREGMPGTAMPGWKPFLTEADAIWIARALQKGFPE